MASDPDVREFMGKTTEAIENLKGTVSEGFRETQRQVGAVHRRVDGLVSKENCQRAQTVCSSGIARMIEETRRELDTVQEEVMTESQVAQAVSEGLHSQPRSSFLPRNLSEALTVIALLIAGALGVWGFLSSQMSQKVDATLQTKQVEFQEKTIQTMERMIQQMQQQQQPYGPIRTQPVSP